MPDLVVQYLDGRKLRAGREYLIWFGGDTNRPVELEVALRWVPAGQVDPHEPVSLLRALGVATAEATNSFHRHYCLGAMR